MKLKAGKFALAGAIFAGITMVTLTIVNSFGIYTGATLVMQDVHMYYNTSFWGTLTGVIEAGIITYLSIWLFIWIYNQLVGGKKKK
ncbi:MAG: hypothetical protein CO137_02620 [Candidatus Magasanikbacteria bacterium CG_4_9_14_3_um_filter_32_9]|uniref:Uncharacterized protein n=1 Tax=Candidatus Magasanikbacteria bacterium CG_4_9_14_3_um_filter_32_9 TaxID=1974644 RepID=A0A2M7Z6N4_9BACT|nr:MAG: hypothetical protein CO137_02620 [Candidatus Magasanikbacteria bacterium CG_4_9_14_3_um_filter_32_9]